MTSLKKNIVLGTIWSIIGQFGYVGVVLVTNIILSRILSPYIFGQIGIVMFFIILFNVLVEGGMGGALIRKKEVSSQDYTTVFIFNLLISLILFFGLFIFAGNIAAYYRDSNLKNILIVSGLILIFNSFQLVHNIKLTRELKFKKKSVYSLVSIIFASIIGVKMAFNGFGVWAMVFIQLLNSIFVSIILWIFEGGLGKLIFSKESFKELIGFGANTTIALMVNTGFENIYQLVLGRYFSINQVGLFYQAKRLMDMPSTVVAVTGSGVIYSAISKLQDEKEKFIVAFDKILFTYLSGIGLISTLSFIYSKEIMVFLYGSKWEGASYYMKILSVVTFLYSANIINELIFKVFDKTKRIVQIMFFRNFVQLVTIFLGAYFHNLDILIYGFFLAIFTSFLSYFYLSRKVLGIFKKEEIYNFVKIVSISVFLIIIFNFGINIFQMKGLIAFIFVPVIIVIYVFGIQYLKVLDIFSQLRLFVESRK
ncbi:MAG: lipopolysaccharide biosynthesis protein [Limnohabitans sp.]|nr:lipopolysaccharide biosynthesis protein [Limnohabitans sp.]